MNMNIFNLFEAEFKYIVESMKAEDILPADVDTGRVVFELPRDASHGDLACNAAMVLAKQVGAKSRDLAAQVLRPNGADRKLSGFWKERDTRQDDQQREAASSPSHCEIWLVLSLQVGSGARCTNWLCAGAGI